MRYLLKSRPVALIGAVMLAIVVAGWALRQSEPAAAAVAPEPVPGAPTVMGADSLRLAPGAPQLALLRTQAVHVGPLPLSEPLPARLAYDEDATARIGAGFSGRVLRLLAAPGDRVRAGQPLAEIDSPDFGLALSDLAKARADEQRKRLAFERAQALYAADAIARKDEEGAAADDAQARAETRRAEQRLHNLNPSGLAVTGERLQLASPIAGTVTERNANPGMELGGGVAAPLFVVADLRRLWLLIDLPERLLGAVQPGGPVAVEADAQPGQRLEARVLQVGAVVDPATRRITVRCRIDNPTLQLRPEMFMRAVLLQPAGSGIELPNTALVSQGLNAYAFVQTAPGEFERRRVGVARRGSETSTVTDGLRDGEVVVVEGALLLAAELQAGPGSKP
jgi:cobalt-zinc-cadmium efflux system membrane fusion protein